MASHKIFDEGGRTMDTQVLTLVVGLSLLTFAGAVFTWAFATRRRVYR